MTAVTTTTPPGWYPEPGHTGNGPAMERWWDGTTWTEYTRTAPVAAGVPQPYPGYPSDVIASGGGGGRRTSTVVIAIVAALVLIGGVVAGIVVLGKSGDDNDAKAKNPPAPSASAPDRGQVPSPQGSPDPNLPGVPQDPGARGDGTQAIDAYDGVSLPVLSGWQGSSGSSAAPGVGANVVIGNYPCPGDSKQVCVRGGAFAEPAAALKLKSTTAEAAAKEDIAPNAANSYSTDIYGATTSHQQVLSKAVTVAGQQGYLVRWKIATKSGTGGYVQSLVFPSPSDSKKLVVVRFGFDIGGQSPSVDLMDQITQGIKADTSGGSSGTGV